MSEISFRNRAQAAQTEIQMILNKYKVSLKPTMGFADMEGAEVPERRSVLRQRPEKKVTPDNTPTVEMPPAVAPEPGPTKEKVDQPVKKEKVLPKNVKKDGDDKLRKRVKVQ